MSKKRVYNTETYDEKGVFYRKKDWSFEVEDDFSKENFTEEVPIGLDLDVIPKQHYDNGWVLDEAEDQGVLDSMVILSKLQLYRALKALNLWKEEVKPLIKGNEDFEDAWDNAVEIDTSDPVFLQGFGMTSINMDTVKREIIKQSLT